MAGSTGCGLLRPSRGPSQSTGLPYTGETFRHLLVLQFLPHTDCLTRSQGPGDIRHPSTSHTQTLPHQVLRTLGTSEMMLRLMIQWVTCSLTDKSFPTAAHLPVSGAPDTRRSPEQRLRLTQNGLQTTRGSAGWGQSLGSYEGRESLFPAVEKTGRALFKTPSIPETELQVNTVWGSER